MDFAAHFSQLRLEAEQALDRFVPAAQTRPARLHTAMRYSLEAGGKRIRPILVLAAADLFGKRAAAAAAAAAVECVHTYSLIHDDLPALDNDDLRRGRPTCHKAFDEPTAILAGDALLTHAFALLATGYAEHPDLAAALVRELGQAAGSTELIGGQMEDIEAERTPATREQVEFIHNGKTAAMIAVSLALGGLIGGASVAQLDTFRQLGREVGLAFQVIDDVLDATATSAELGKTAGKDAQADKATMVRVLGLEGARERAAQHTAAALAKLVQLPGDTAFLRALVESLLRRGN
ncbi:MAG: polyprenyl synthetase family protein [Opitutaceae bacterium]